jgi:hypothetical protein
MGKQIEVLSHLEKRLSDVPRLPIFGVATRKLLAFLNNPRKWKWVWLPIIVLLCMESYAMRELFFALLFFVIFYVLLAAVAMLYVLFIDGLDHGSTWIAVLGRALVFLMRHHFAFSSRVVDLPKHTALHLVRKGKAARHGIH